MNKLARRRVWHVCGYDRGSERSLFALRGRRPNGHGPHSFAFRLRSCNVQERDRYTAPYVV